MLDTQEFVNGLIDKQYTHLCVVPCSFAKNLINCVINNPSINYLPCASEAIACSIAAGLKMSGNKPIVVVQSSGVTNMGSCITSLLKPCDVTFPIISSWRTYREGDSEIQHRHLAVELPKLIEAYGYQSVILNTEQIDMALEQLDYSNDNQQICILKQGTFSSITLERQYQLDLSSFKPRGEYLRLLNDSYKNSNSIFIGTTGNTAREMYQFMPDTDNFYMAGNMGGALSLGLGAALSGKSVIVCGGDAESVMHMGGMTTAGRYAEDINLIYILFDNESNKSTGGQNSYQQHLDYIQIAKSCNFIVVEDIVTDPQAFIEVIQQVSNNNGLKFICVKCGYDEEVARPPLEVVKRGQF